MVIMCNPYGYGFRRPHEAEALLKELTRVLANEGKIIIIANLRNKYCNPTRVQKIIRQVSPNGVGLIDFTVDDIDPKTLYSGHCFFRTDGSETRPTKRITLHVK